ncbi:clusterin [Xyrichtys novacula]|uniref:Clusterin n=1 Tax=Xyrichtys novacula TaxID=13765 RepID=A0AAV1H0Y7_XYRNO|nr:clusterin [Xyrichtys novacula]
MLMMMMMMKKKGSKSLALFALLLASANCVLPPTKDDLTQISLQGEQYLDKQIENAVNGVKEMKTVMQKSSEEHQRFVDALKKTKEQKEEAMRTAQEMEAKLEKEEEEKYTEMADGVDSIFTDSMKVEDHIHYSPPVFFLSPFARHSRSIRSLFRDPFHGFQNLFSPMMGMGRNFFSSMGSVMDFDTDMTPNEDGDVNEDVVITKPFGNGQMTCREIRRNSAGCIRFKDECQKCKDIQHIDCSGKRPLEGPLKEELETALAMTERFTQQYNKLLRRFEEKMFNTSSILEMLNRQFGWVSALANSTKDDIFKIQGVICRDSEEKPGETEKEPEETKVSVKLFDSPPMNFTVPGDIPWTDPKFSEVVAQEALDRYKETSVVLK